MARTVIVFRDNMIERERLAADQTDTGARARAARRKHRGDHRAFRSSVEQALGKLRGAARAARDVSATKLNGAADAVSAEAQHRRGPRRRRLRERHRGRQLGRGARRLDRRDREPGRQVDRGRRPRGVRGAAHRPDHDRTRRRRDPHRRGDRADPGDRRADQPAGAQRHHRGGARRRGRPRLRGGRLRGEVARRPDRQGDRGDRRADRRDPVRRGRRRAGDRAGQRHHRATCRRSPSTRRGHGRGAERRGLVDRRRRQPRLGRSAAAAPRP